MSTCPHVRRLGGSRRGVNSALLAGMSGSPIISDDGAAIGIVNLGSSTPKMADKREGKLDGKMLVYHSLQSLGALRPSALPARAGGFTFSPT
jgi:hypothetical protein